MIIDLILIALLVIVALQGLVLGSQNKLVKTQREYIEELCKMRDSQRNPTLKGDKE